MQPNSKETDVAEHETTLSFDGGERKRLSRYAIAALKEKFDKWKRDSVSNPAAIPPMSNVLSAGQTVGDSHIIVQPGDSYSEDFFRNSHNMFKTKAQKMKEIKEIRDSINFAVEHNKYAHLSGESQQNEDASDDSVTPEPSTKTTTYRPLTIFDIFARPSSQSGDSFSIFDLLGNSKMKPKLPEFLLPGNKKLKNLKVVPLQQQTSAESTEAEIPESETPIEQIDEQPAVPQLPISIATQPIDSFRNLNSDESVPGFELPAIGEGSAPAQLPISLPGQDLTPSLPVQDLIPSNPLGLGEALEEPIDPLSVISGDRIMPEEVIPMDLGSTLKVNRPDLSQNNLHSSMPVFKYLEDENFEDEAMPTPLSLTLQHGKDVPDDRRINEKADEMMAKMNKHAKGEKITANIVDSHAMDGESKNNLILSDEHENLHIKGIVEDLKFHFGHNITAWKTIQRNGHEKHALVGLTATSVILMQERDGIYIMKGEIPMLTTPKSFTTFVHWNESMQSIQGIVIVGTQEELVFLRVNEALDYIEVYWIVQMHRPVATLEYFIINNEKLLMIVTEDIRPAAHMYRFDIDQYEFWLRESLSLTTKTSSIAYLETGVDHFICIAQNTSAIVFKFTKERFTFFNEYRGTEINTISAFEMGGNSYLAIGGSKPRILRYYRGNFYDQTILTPTWGIVEYFMPIPTRTYRDDLILLIQHRIEFQTHSISVLEALIWNNDVFDPVYSIPCYIGNKKSSRGLDCVIDEDRDAGIGGATVFQRNKFITILTPRHEAPSGLFDMEFELLPATYTYDEDLLETFAKVLLLLEAREEWLKDAKETLNEFNEMQSSEYEINGGDFDLIETHELIIESKILPTENIYFGTEKINANILEHFNDALNKSNIANTSQFNPRTKRADMDGAGNDVAKNITENIDFLQVDYLFVDFINEIPVKELIFIENGMVKLNGTLVLEQSIEFNEIEWKNTQLVGEDEHFMEKLDIRGDFTFEEINGLSWRNLMNEIVWKNQPDDLPALTIRGVIDNLENFIFFSHSFQLFLFQEIIAEDVLTIQNLNNLSFPGAFFWNDGRSESVITGRKEFTNLLGDIIFFCFSLINSNQSINKYVVFFILFDFQ